MTTVTTYDSSENDLSNICNIKTYYQSESATYLNVTTGYNQGGVDIGKILTAKTSSTVDGTITPCGYSANIMQMNTGANWIEAGSTSSLIRNWISVSVVDKAAFPSIESGGASAVVSGGTNFYSTNSGRFWRIAQTSLQTVNWTGVAFSSNGNNAVACVSPGGLYYSEFNGGQLFQLANNIVDQIFSGVSISSSNPIIAVACIFGDRLVYSYDNGKNWSYSGSAITANWTSVSVSATGQYAVSCIDNGKIYYSNDYCATWIVTNSTTQIWKSVSISSSGQYAIACVDNGKIHYSNDYCINWTESNSPPANWRSVSISATGQYVVACIYGGQIYYSNDNGQKWNVSNSITGNWTSVSISPNGTNAIACIYGGKLYYSLGYESTTFVLQDLTTVFEPVYKYNTWNQSNMTQNGLQVSISSSGKNAVALIGGRIWYSTNFGIDWTESIGSAAGRWSGIAISASGKYVFACQEDQQNANSRLYYSTDSGQNFILSPSTFSDSKYWKGISISATGQYGLVGRTYVNSRLYRSTNYGVNWSVTALLVTGNWTSTSISATGQYSIACRFGLPIYYSTDYSINFTASNSPSVNWNSVSMSQSGKYAIAGPNGGQLYFSSTSGSTWSVVTSSISDNWISVSISQSGQYAIAVSSTKVYYSNNYGSTFTEITTLSPGSVAISNSGQYAIIINSGGIYTCKATN